MLRLSKSLFSAAISFFSSIRVIWSTSSQSTWFLGICLKKNACVTEMRFPWLSWSILEKENSSPSRKTYVCVHLTEDDHFLRLVCWRIFEKLHHQKDGERNSKVINILVLILVLIIWINDCTQMAKAIKTTTV